jgi:hypothetical protein
MARRINMHMCLNGKEHMYISIRLECIDDFSCLTYLYAYEVEWDGTYAYVYR